VPPLLLPAGCSGRQARGLLWGQKEGRPRREASHSAAAAGEDTRQWSRTVSAQAKWLQWGKASGPDHRSHPCRRQAGRKTGRQEDRQAPHTFVAAPSPGLGAVHGAVARRQHPGRALTVGLGRLQLCVCEQAGSRHDDSKEGCTCAASLSMNVCWAGSAAAGGQAGQGGAGRQGMGMLAWRSASIHSYMRRISASPNSSGQKKTSAGSRGRRQPPVGYVLVAAPGCCPKGT
jgi:hypothetical protein